MPRPPIFQLPPVKDPEDTSVDEMPTRLKQDSNDSVRNVHPAFAQTQLQPFGPAPAPPQPWLEPEPVVPPAPQSFPVALGATTLQGLGEAERMQQGYPPGPPATGPGFIPPRLADEMSHTTADLSGRKLVLTPIAVGAAAGLLVTVVVVGVILLVRSPAEVPSRASSATSQALSGSPPPTAERAAPTPTNASAAVTTGSALAKPPTEADAKAQAALEKLKSGIEYCVKSTIHVLPGASPPVPSSIAWLKSGPYESLKRDWASPFFSCTRFKLDEPMPFMIQWQVDTPNEKGTAIVWLDPDGDGSVDRAYGFKATLTKRDKVEFGPVEPIDPTRKIQRAR